jgi:hypothetical protein
MSVTDHEGRIQVNYSQKTVFKTCLDACKLIEGFSIDKKDDIAKVIYLKAKLSLFSWGETITINIIKVEDSLSNINIISTPKIGMGANAPGLYGDMGKNRKNINKIQQAITNELSKYPEEYKKEIGNQNSIADEIKKFAELRDSGILTEEEFQTKKKQILNL